MASFIVNNTMRFSHFACDFNCCKQYYVTARARSREKCGVTRIFVIDEFFCKNSLRGSNSFISRSFLL